MISIIGLLVILGIASYYDIKTLEIPLYLFLVPIALQIVQIVVSGTSFQIYLIASVLTFMLFYAFSKMSQFGGGDVLLLTSIAFVEGEFVIWAALLSFLCCLPYTIWMKVKKKEKAYPFAPFLFLGALISIPIMWKGGGIL